MNRTAIELKPVSMISAGITVGTVRSILLDGTTHCLKRILFIRIAEPIYCITRDVRVYFVHRWRVGKDDVREKDVLVRNRCFLALSCGLLILRTADTYR